VRAIDWQDDSVVIIEQTLLPGELRLVTLRHPPELVAAIQRLAVRGAMALGVAGAMGVALGAVRAREAGVDVAAAVTEAAELLIAARPTAANLAWGVEQARAAVAQGPDAVVAAALAVRDADVAANHEIGRRGAEVLAGARRVLTHCNTGALASVEHGTALGVIRDLNAVRPLDLVYVDETRPLLQGSRLTAWELQREDIPFRILVDSAAAGVIVGGGVDAVVVGADRIAANGDTANKVGTLSVALAAARAGIPFVVAAPEATISPGTATGADIPIEERDHDEVLTLAGARVAPVGAPAFNPAFDVTPAALITAIVTESRVWRPALGGSTSTVTPIDPSAGVLA
jgi:methylthioribose-1-phosphate isomerase